MTDEYKRSCADELSWTDIEQLHAATLQIGNSCFEYKKLCVGFLAASITFLAKFSTTAIDNSLFIIVSIIIVGFWIADATAYYYQKVVRKMMSQKKQEIAERNGVVNYSGEEILVSNVASLFNGSMTLYYVLLGLDVTSWLLFVTGTIK